MDVRGRTPAPPRIGRAVRSAASDFVANSWRLVAPNLAWGACLLLLLGTRGMSAVTLLLVPLLAVPTIGVYRVAALIARDEPVGALDGFRCWPAFGARALIVGTSLYVAVVLFGTNFITGIQTGDVVGWSLATFAGWGLVVVAILSAVIWPLLVDPWRATLGLRGVTRLAGLLALAFPVRFGVLAIVLGIIFALSTVAVVAVLTVAVAFAAPVACRYVLPAADRFAPPPDRPADVV